MAAAMGGGSGSAASRAAGWGLATLLKAGTPTSMRQVLDGVYAHTPPGVVKFNDLVVSSGEGCWISTTDGRRFLDMTSGIGAVSTGHCHPAVVEAVRRQAGRVVHAQQNVFGAHEAMVDLYDRLSAVLPPSLDTYFLANSGAEAVDNAVKIARAATGRQNVIAFEVSPRGPASSLIPACFTSSSTHGGFHGRTLGSMALTSSKTIYRQGFGPLMPGVHIAPYPYCLHCKAQVARGHAGYPYPAEQAASAAAAAAAGYGDSSGGGCSSSSTMSSQAARDISCCGGPLESLEWMLSTQTAPADTAAVILEPLLGEGGFLVPPPGFLEGLRKLCNKHGILLIADEVQAGAGRTGRWWGHQHWLPTTNTAAPSQPQSQPSAEAVGGGPDLVVFAKGIASGYPLAGVAMRRELVPASKMPPGTLGGTYGANAVACAAASATIDVINGEGLVRNAAVRGVQLMTGLAELAAQLPPGLIADVRGRGLMVGVEFGGGVSCGGGEGGGGSGPSAPRYTPARKGVASAITKACAARGMLLLTAGARECIRFLPPLTISQEEVRQALDTFGEVCREVLLRQ
ncbi:hypothetical protein VOLCADRAFT_90848 [Volvox carteri f. nagariensis]|uniref:4-aminobutyrate aminotransferase n=1 Tax=Volvox carteri f. nagariensis TaxID=3068 RepID=D8TV79_VOLCA|nr:uncharacterized protein VOLCADRAFT_90848 [Volvox carteri f. nagariensis]EFJ48529.1 hypothetical protein VOLCADRAFT_90848 [Volvox carteri f. nagariensis]|eukprot:XP_002950328.1 hypothetical protein VOLCADRAFT_90848 [Volvox carteri f. nagariensis]